MKTVRISLAFIVFIIETIIMFAFIDFSAQVIRDLHIFPLVDGEVSANAWLDKNGNGLRDDNEPPLEGVCIWIQPDPRNYNTTNHCDSEHFRTNSEGRWFEFFAGGNPEEPFIIAVAPTGYQLSTSPVVKGYSAEFGFAPLSIELKQKISIEEVFGAEIKRYEQHEVQKHFVENAKNILGWASIITFLIGLLVLAWFMAGRILSTLFKVLR